MCSVPVLRPFLFPRCYPSIHGYAAVELIFGYKPRFTKDEQSFEDEIQNKDIVGQVESLLREEKSVQEAVYLQRLAHMDEIRDKAGIRMLEKQAEVEERSLKKLKKPRRVPKAGDLILLRR